MSRFGKKGVRCNWCGKFANNSAGEYTKPDGISCGYIRQPEWHVNDDGSVKPEFADSTLDICEECAASQCPYCGSGEVLRVVPMTPGPDGWGGRCKSCGKRWAMSATVV